MNTSLIKYLQGFKIMTLEEQQRVMDDFQRVDYKSGEVLASAGKVAQDLFFIVEGILKITIPDARKRPHAYFFMEENQFMGFLYSLYGKVPCEQGLEAATDCVVLKIERSKLFSLFDALPFLKSVIDQIAHLSMVEMIKTKNFYLSGNSAERYQKLLLHQPGLVLKVPLIDIASYIGVTPQSLSRIRRSVS